MDPLPALPLDPNTIKDELTKEQRFLLAKSFVILSLYLQEQHAKCGMNEEEDGNLGAENTE